MRNNLVILLLLLNFMTFSQSKQIFENDSLLTINNKNISNDSANINKIEILNNSLDRLVSKLIENENKRFDPIWHIVVGALLSMVIQIVIESCKTKKEKETRRIELIAKGRAKIYLIAQIISDLAMYKVHKQYYARLSDIATDTNERDKYYERHYEKGEQQRATEVKFDENVAEYFQLVTEYSVMSKNQDSFNKYFNNIYEYVHPKSKKFEDVNDCRVLMDALMYEEKKLISDYKILLKLFELIQNEMK